MAKKNTAQAADDFDEEDVLPIDLEDNGAEMDVKFSEDEEEDDTSSDENDEAQLENEQPSQQPQPNNDELEALRADNIRLRKAEMDANIGRVEQYEEQVTAQIDGLIDKIAEAEEEGDIKAKYKLEMQLSDLRDQRTKARNAKATLVSERDKINTAPPPKQEAQPQHPQTTGQFTAVEQSWMQKNQWYNSPKTPNDFMKKGYVDTVYYQLIDDGYKKGTQAFITELDKRLTAMTNKSNNRGNRPHGHVPPVNNTPARSGAGKNSITLDRNDAYLLEQAGIDIKKDKAMAKGLHAIMMQENTPEYAKSRRVVIPTI